MSYNEYIINWVDQIKNLTNPKDIVFITGDDKQIESIKESCLNDGTIKKLNDNYWPNCYLHNSDVNDVARVEERTFICSDTKELAGPTNNWWDKTEAKEKLSSLFKNCMHGKTMYVIPFLMGPPNSKFAKVGIQITDSKYVVLNMNIMSKIGDIAIENLDGNKFVKCIHSSADLNPNERYICHFPESNEIYSINSAYGGNAILSKKCFALRIASNLAKKEGWLAEHMLILCVTKPDGNKVYIAASFPSACGKTNLAMIIPPEIYQKEGYKVECIGDDIAWLKIGEDGRLYAVNPENGFFGVLPGTSEKTNPIAIQTIKKDTLFTNVAYDEDTNGVWWEGLNEKRPKNGFDWKQDKIKDDGNPLAHPNSRFTSSVKNCPILSEDYNAPEGVPISILIFGGRRNKLLPLVFESFDFTHGVFLGSIMGSETTAAATGKPGIVRRDPMAMLPFCGYNMSDYFKHWIDMGEKMADNAPKVFMVNWFKTDKNGKFLWNGFRDNFRVLLWMIARCEDKLDAIKKPIGYLPKVEDIDLREIKSTTDKQLSELLLFENDLWKKEVLEIEDFYKSFNGKVPIDLENHLSDLKEEL